MKPLAKLLGAIAFLIASGSVLALEPSAFKLAFVADPADWMLLSGLITIGSISRRRRIPAQMGLWPSGMAIRWHSPNGSATAHKPHSAPPVAFASGS